MTPLLVHPYKKKQFMIISLLYSLHSLVSPVSLQKWIFVNSDQKLWKADIKASADIQFCLVFCLYFLLFYRYSRIVDVFFIVGLRARGQPDLDTIFSYGFQKHFDFVIECSLQTLHIHTLQMRWFSLGVSSFPSP